MNVFLRIASLAAASVALCGTALAQQTLTFSNTNPQIAVDLTGTLGISTTGNVTASCVPKTVGTPPAVICDGMPAGTGGLGLPPTVSLAASNFSGSQDANQRYTPGTTFTLTPSVSGSGPSTGEVCLRLLTAGSPAVSGWSGAVASPFTAQTVAVNAQNATYGFQIRCFSEGGAATSSQNIQVMTNDGGTQPTGCESITAPNGYTRQQPPAAFTEVPLVTPSGSFMGLFPVGGGGQGRVVPNRGRYMSIEFRAPTDLSVYNGLAKQFNWLEAQQAGFSVNLSAIYVTVSQCPGDFRIPVGSTTAPPADPTYAAGCRNWRPFTQGGNNLFLRGIDYNIGSTPSDFDTCMIAPGGTYYFNFILASPVGGIVPDENPCSNQQANACGIQMSME